MQMTEIKSIAKQYHIKAGKLKKTELIKQIQIAEGNNVAITPDGPRGPALRVSEGVIKLAQITGARIIPVSYDATRKRLLKSWDRFMVVLPFGRVHVAFADPIEVPRRIAPSF